MLRFAIQLVCVLVVLISFVWYRPRAAAEEASSAAERTADLKQGIQRKIDALREQIGFPGATVGCVLRGGETLVFATGYSDLERKIAMRPSDRMLAGSAGKTFVAAIVLRLVQSGKLGLDDRVAKWLGKESWYPKLPNADEITVRMLLDHTSGLPEYLKHESILAALRKSPDKVWKPEERLAPLLGGKALSKAGKRHHYADTNFILLGALIEKVAASPYAEVLRSLLKELDLKEIQPSESRALANLVPGYTVDTGSLGLMDLTTKVTVHDKAMGKVVDEGRYFFNPQLEWTGGGVVASAGDLARWAHALFEGDVVRDQYVSEMVLNRHRGYGLGVQIRHSGFWGLTYGHSGWMPGYSVAMEYFPDYRVSIAVMLNVDELQESHPRHVLLEVMRVVAESSGGR